MGNQSINKATLIGRVGADPEIRYTADGTMVVNLRIATDESYKTKAGEKVERTEWHRIVAWRKLAEIMANYITKGRLIYIEGRLTTRKWQDKDGADHYTTEIIASSMVLLDSSGQKKENPQGQGPGSEPGWDGSYHGDDEDVPF